MASDMESLVSELLSKCYHQKQRIAARAKLSQPYAETDSLFPFSPQEETAR